MMGGSERKRQFSFNSISIIISIIIIIVISIMISSKSAQQIIDESDWTINNSNNNKTTTTSATTTTSTTTTTNDSIITTSVQNIFDLAVPCSAQDVIINLATDRETSSSSASSPTISAINRSTALVFPNYVRARRCVGGCGRSGLENALHRCSPTPDGVQHRPIVQLVQTLGRRTLRPRRLLIAEHIACHCPCAGRAPDGKCPLPTQRFDESKCRCKCANGSVERSRCRSSTFGGMLLWDETRCECRCAAHMRAESIVRLLDSGPKISNSTSGSNLISISYSSPCPSSALFEFDETRCACVWRSRS